MQLEICVRISTAIFVVAIKDKLIIHYCDLDGHGNNHTDQVDLLLCSVAVWKCRTCLRFACVNGGSV